MNIQICFIFVPFKVSICNVTYHPACRADPLNQIFSERRPNVHFQQWMWSARLYPGRGDLTVALWIHLSWRKKQLITFWAPAYWIKASSVTERIPQKWIYNHVSRLCVHQETILIAHTDFRIFEPLLSVGKGVPVSGWGLATSHMSPHPWCFPLTTAWPGTWQEVTQQDPFSAQ